MKETRHLFKNGNRQNCCLWCRKPSILADTFEECPVAQPIRRALADFAASNGRNWKSKLIDSWTRGDVLSTELQQARNILGPSKLLKVSSRVLELVPA